MSEEKKFITRWSRDFQGNLQEDPNGSWVLAADAAIRDKRLMDKIDALQALLTAADEKNDTLSTAYVSAGEREHLLRLRVDVLEGLLRRVVESSVLSFEQDAPEALESLEADICAALKPAEAAKDEHVCTG
ncbi:MAG: hypothetical protein KIC49_11710 [Pseudomonas fluorescens]|nr:hypothetical protein [Pseudomonas fluorescens]